MLQLRKFRPLLAMRSASNLNSCWFCCCIVSHSIQNGYRNQLTTAEFASSRRIHGMSSHPQGHFCTSRINYCNAGLNVNMFGMMVKIPSCQFVFQVSTCLGASVSVLASLPVAILSAAPVPISICVPLVIILHSLPCTLCVIMVVGPFTTVFNLV